MSCAVCPSQPLPPDVSYSLLLLRVLLYRVFGRRGQLLGVPCAPVSTAGKVFSLAESHAELILKMHSMGSYCTVLRRLQDRHHRHLRSRRCASAHSPALSTPRARSPDSRVCAARLLAARGRSVPSSPVACAKGPAQVVCQVWSVWYQGVLLGLWDPQNRDLPSTSKTTTRNEVLEWLIITPLWGG